MNASEMFSDRAMLDGTRPTGVNVLVHGQEVRTANSKPHHHIVVGSGLGYCNKVNHEVASEHAWTTRAVCVLDDAPMHVKQSRTKSRHEAWMGATELKDGDIVWIDGKTMNVRILGLQYADPISFQFV